MNDEDPVVKGSAAGAMAIFGEESIQYLLQVLANPTSSSMQCGLATWALGFIGASAPEGIKKAAKSSNSLIRAAAIGALEDIIKSSDDDETKDLLLEGLNDPISEVRLEATRLIVNINDHELVEKLLQIKLNDKDILVRKNAVFSLIKIKSVNSLAKLKSRISIEKESNMINIIKLAVREISKSDEKNL